MVTDDDDHDHNNNQISVHSIGLHLSWGASSLLPSLLKLASGCERALPIMRQSAIRVPPKHKPIMKSEHILDC